ncbi:MAG: hypothetical protein HOJ15_02310 [Candidatus Jacksonbacteria bacterium]|jgi:hypothetical protein|nr:hypothetical protein [Candidatus Jacksonbacteria bacterium]MBT6301239.1 hypothetical protein [Candidatus Jacksonbacteria bacterium]MBT6955344.1 hypothetical protein [Candidatus Jacksonbacteria bacterium]
MSSPESRPFSPEDAPQVHIEFPEKPPTEDNWIEKAQSILDNIPSEWETTEPEEKEDGLEVTLETNKATATFRIYFDAENKKTMCRVSSNIKINGPGGRHFYPNLRKANGTVIEFTEETITNILEDE